VGNRSGQGPETRDPCHVGELRSELAESLSGEPALRHVLNRSYIFQVTVLVSRRVGPRAHVLDRAVCHAQANFEILVVSGISCLVHLFRQNELVIRVNSAANPLRRHGRVKLKIEDATCLFRKHNLVRIQTPGEGPSRTETLTFCEKRLFALQLVFGVLLVFNICNQDIPAGDFAVCISNRPRSSPKPSIDSIGSAETFFMFVRSSGLDRVIEDLD